DRGVRPLRPFHQRAVRGPGDARRIGGRGALRSHLRAGRHQAMSELSTFFRSRTGVYTALGLGIAAFVLVVVTPVVAAFAAQNGDIDDMLQQLGSYRAEIAAKPALKAQLAELDRQGATVPGVIEGDTTS